MKDLGHRLRRAGPRVRRWRRCVAAPAAAAALLSAAAPALAGSSAVVFMYHRFGESAHPSTNISMAQFDAHLDLLKSGKFTVLPLPEIVSAVREGRDLPDRAVGLSVDDAFMSLYTTGWPKLRESGLPFTLFVATDAIDRGFRDYMSWTQIREMAASGVTIGSQTASHPHMPLRTAEQNTAELAKSNERFERELGARPTLFAYPFGENSRAVQTLVRDTGFEAAFGQHSGVLYHGGDYFYMPRFAMNEAYGGLERFNLAANALPIETDGIAPSDPLLSGRSNPPPLAFTVTGPARQGLAALACYASGQGRAGVEQFGQGRILVRVPQAFPPGRARINCTLPAGEGRWRWFGMQYYVPEP